MMADQLIPGPRGMLTLEEFFAQEPEGRRYIMIWDGPIISAGEKFLADCRPGGPIKRRRNFLRPQTWVRPRVDSRAEVKRLVGEMQTELKPSTMTNSYLEGWVERYVDFRRAIEAQSAERQLVVTPVPLTVANSNLRTPAGAFAVRRIYAAHPHNAQYYFPYETFHRDVIFDKLQEALWLLANLCATKARIEDVEVHRTRKARGGSAGYDPVELVGQYRVERGMQNSALVTLEAPENGGECEPAVPEDLVWFPHEPTWQRLAKSRIDKRSRTGWGMTLSNQTSYGVSNEVGLIINGIKLGYKSEYKGFRETRWEMSVSFGSKDPERIKPEPPPGPIEEAFTAALAGLGRLFN